MLVTSPKRLLAASAAASLVGGLSLGLLSAPSDAGTIFLAEIPQSTGEDFYDLDVVSTGPGDAVAAVAADGEITLHTAVDGKWVGRAELPPVVVIDNADNLTGNDVRLAVNNLGKVAVAWKDPTGRLWASRQLDPSHWSTPTSMTTDVVRDHEFDIGISDDGLVIAVAAVDSGLDAPDAAKMRVTEWPKGKPTVTKVLAGSGATAPALDVNNKGKALLAWRNVAGTGTPVKVARRLPASGWSPASAIAGSDLPGSQEDGTVDVTLSDNGWGHIAYLADQDGSTVVKSNRMLVDGFGVLMPAQRISPLGEEAHDPSVDTNATGSAVFAWGADKGGAQSVRYAEASKSGDPGVSQVLATNLGGWLRPVARINNNGLRVIQFRTDITFVCPLCEGNKIVTHYRLAAAPKYSSAATSAGYSYLNGVGVDSGNDFVVVATPYDGYGQVFGRFVDAVTGAPYGG